MSQAPWTGRALTLSVCWVALAACGEGVTEPPSEAEVPVRIVTFGDSNLDGGWDASGALRARSYVSKEPMRLAAQDPNDPTQLAGKIEALWRAAGRDLITAVNHAIGGTTTGGGGFGGSDRHSSGSPNARVAVNGVTRFEAEVLGRGAPLWHGDEPVNERYPEGPIVRARAFAPGPDDFAFISIGTNDPVSGVEPTETIANLRWMATEWIQAGLPPAHFILATLPPSVPGATYGLPGINEAIRGLGPELGIHVIDLAAHLSDDDGLTWRSDDLHLGDQLHYSEPVRDWIASRIVDHMLARVPATRAVARAAS